MRHFKEDNEDVIDEDFPMIGLHSQRNEDYSNLYNHFSSQDEGKTEKNQ